MRILSYLIQMLEKISKSDSILSKVLSIFLYRSLVEKLWTPLKVICYNPFLALALVILLYLVFLIIFLPLWAASFILTSYGSFVLFIFFLNFLSIFVARKVSFPGSSSSTTKQMSSEFSRRLAFILESLSVKAIELSANLVLFLTGRIAHAEMKLYEEKVNELMEMNKSTQSLSLYLDGSVSFLQKNKLITNDEYLLLRQLVLNLKAFKENCPIFCTEAQTYLHQLRHFHNYGSNISSPQSSNLLTTTSQFLKASEALKSSVDSIRPQKSVSSNGGQDPSGLDMQNLQGGYPAILDLFGKLFSKNELSFIEKISFPYMREMLKDQYKAIQFSLKGFNGDTVDGIMIRFQENIDSPLLRLPAGINERKGLQGGNTKCVLFCSPNAGFYECLSQFEADNSWVGFYLRHGFDVCMFNYRGYGLSTGAPTPIGVKRDGCLVYDFIMKKYSPDILLVHGESIGGMVASYLASHRRIQALICDRTFSSLESVANRLMGSWAAYGLTVGALWCTDVVQDYLSAECPKLIIQDPNDEIVSNLASLKCGVANYLAMRDKRWTLGRLPSEYSTALFLKGQLPNEGSHEDCLLQRFKDWHPGQSVPYDFICHFYACLMDLSQKAKDFKRIVQSIRSVGDQSADFGFLSSTEEGRLHSHAHTKPHKASCQPKDLGLDEEAFLSTNNTEEDDDSPMMNFDATDNGAPLFDSDEENDHGNSFHGLSSPRLRPINWLNEFCKISLQDKRFPPEILAWISATRVYGGAGQILIHATQQGLDAVRCWLTCFLVWGENAFPDASLQSSCPDMNKATQDIEHLMQFIYPNELTQNRSLRFVYEAFKVCLSKRTVQVPYWSSEASRGTVSMNNNMNSNKLDSSFARSDLQTMVPCYDRYSCCQQRIEEFPMIHSYFIDKSQPTHVCHSCTANTGWSGGPDVVPDTREKVATTSSFGHPTQLEPISHQQHEISHRNYYIGKLLNVHCGHNGFVAQEDSHFVSQFLSTNNLL